MIYNTLRWIAGVALHWFYRDIRVIDRNRIPESGPLLIAVNHQNALIDSLVVGCIIQRRVAITAKATLMDNRLVALFFKLLRVVPLRRASDEASNSAHRSVDRSRNLGAFHEIIKTLQQGGAVLIFPEGKSHNEDGLEPLKTGLARLAIQARDREGVQRVRILPLGLVFEDKSTPYTVVGVHIGQPIDMDTWPGSDHVDLTSEIANRLRRLSQYATLPASQLCVDPTGNNFIRESLIAVAAWWGRATHQIPIRIARRIAIKRSSNADEPAMLTILFGIGLVLLTYVVHLTLVGLIAHSFLAACLYLVTLVNGAYWAAFQRHPRRR